MKIKDAIEILQKETDTLETYYAYMLKGLTKVKIVEALKVAIQALEEKQAREQTDGWISVEDDMPPEHDSIFAKLYGTEKWNKFMWRKTSGEVNVVKEFENGDRIVTSGYAQDGKFIEKNSVVKSKVTHWQPLPQPPKDKE